MRPSARRRLSRRLGAVTVGLTVFGMVVPTTPAQAAEPATQTSQPSVVRTSSSMNADRGLARIVSASGGSVPVTLITGDTVHVGVDDDGRPVVRGFDSAARPDGPPAAYHTFTRQGRVYVVPDDALVLVGTGLLDWELFDLSELVTLVAAGKGNALPVLVTYGDGARADAMRKVAGASGGRALPSIKGRSMNIAEGGRWWQGVRGKTARTPDAARSAGSLTGVKKVWLNGLSHVDLEKSVPQISAPVAWERGYDGTGVTVAVLDTGVDATHPDLSASIAGQADFTGSPTGTKDGHGHGTHVASTVLGSGAASHGVRKGVAPGSKLLVGKVCDDAGQCPDDAIIAGMDWAAHSGAKVVNLSLGGDPTDGTDPMSLALNELSRSTGTLFVVAAGNSGLIPQKVVAPGSADDALTVAAVDGNGDMASFSNRGPRIGDGAAKPDIAAPGVGIVAARAVGTAMGTPVDEYYTASDGTSMATPHVAGAAAIIAQQHPEFSGEQIKALLMDTADDLGHDLYAQGTGQVDLATATDPRIVTRGNLNFGRGTYPHTPVTRTITYSNRGDKAITLHLTMQASFADGRPAAPGLFTLSTDKAVVPAGGTAEVSVTLDGSVLGTDGAFGSYKGLLSARDDSGVIRLNSGLHTFVEAQKFPLTMKVIPPQGATDVRYGSATFMPVDDKIHLHSDRVNVVSGAPTVTQQLFRGTYAAQTTVSWRNADGQWQQAEPIAPEVSLTKAATVTLDLRKAKPLRVRYPKTTEAYNALATANRVSATGAWSKSTTLQADYKASDPNWWVLPTNKVSMGTFTHDFYSARTTPVVTLRTTGGATPLSLSARYVTPNASLDETQVWLRDNGDLSFREAAIPVPRLPVKGHLSVVYAGTGSAAELADLDVRGKLVLLTPSDLCAGVCDFPKLRDERVAAAAAAGAVGVLVAAADLTSLGRPSELDQCLDGPRSCPPVQTYGPLPVVSVPYTEAQGLIKQLKADRSNVKIGLGGTVVPTVYVARYHDEGQIRPNDYRVDKSDLDQVDLSFHGARRGVVHQLSWMQHLQATPNASQVSMPQPSTQQTMSVFVKRQDDAISRFTASWADLGADSFLEHNRQEVNDVVLTGRNEIHYNAGPAVPGAVPPARTKSGFSVAAGPCSGCRQGDTFYPTVYLTGSGTGGRQAVLGIVNSELISNSFTEVPACGPAPSATLPNLDFTCDVKLLDASGDEVERRTEQLPDYDYTLE
ncbi:subtilisin family serine protease [Streptomyces sp. T12]|uniref:S8 family peptidase n=1 Tax=Streptomyces sp. T12 TaxID=477697 RepID=UPI0011AAC562|nr:S8 family serine peptidase [Streptomyces sp. T12]TWD13593.1 subtilisin family serine protease [Streptomyces sp. T12]